MDRRKEQREPQEQREEKYLCCPRDRAAGRLILVIFSNHVV